MGDVMLDRYWYGRTTPVFPEVPAPVVRIEQTEEHLDGAGNVVLNGRALDADVTLSEHLKGCYQSYTQVDISLLHGAAYQEYLDWLARHIVS